MKLPYKGGGVAIFQKDNTTGEYSILLGKRLNNPDRGKWSIPGGGYEKGDKNLNATALREFSEETELVLNSIILADKTYRWHLWIPFIFEWETILCEIKEDWHLADKRFHEFSEVRQIPLSELKNYMLAFGVKSEVREFIRKNRMEA